MDLEGPAQVAKAAVSILDLVSIGFGRGAFGLLSIICAGEIMDRFTSLKPHTKTGRLIGLAVLWIWILVPMQHWVCYAAYCFWPGWVTYMLFSDD